MRYAGLIKNDLAAAPGVCTTLFVQGCPIHCPGCHNESSWDFDGGAEFNDDVLEGILKALHANGIHRTLCIMGGEPLAEQNIEQVCYIVETVKAAYPDMPIWIWTGYTFDFLLEKYSEDDSVFFRILSVIDHLVDGPYIKDLRDVTLPHRGSLNQQVWEKQIDENNNILWVAPIEMEQKEE